jgi:RecB family exonuclease
LGLGQSWLTADQRAKAELMVTKLAMYVAAMHKEGRALVGVELDVAVEVGRARVTGRVDRLERTPDGALRIVDLKTGKSSPSVKDVETNPQLGVYQVAVEAGAFAGAGATGSADRDGAGAAADDTYGDSYGDGPVSAGGDGPVSAGGELVLLGSATKSLTRRSQPPLPDADDPAWARELLMSVAAGMAGAEFVAQQGAQCRRCPVRSSCPVQPEGRAVTS